MSRHRPVIDGSAALRLRPWQAPRLDEPPPAEAPEQDREAEALDKLRRNAMREGFEQGFAQGLAEGREQGLAEGREQARAEVDRELARLRRLANALVRPLEDLDEEVVQQLMRVAERIATELVRRELSLDPAQLAAIVREAVDAIADEARAVTIRLHPEDAEVLADALEMPEDGSWRLRPDPSLQRGDLQVQAEAMNVDARIETRVRELARMMQTGQ